MDQKKINDFTETPILNVLNNYISKNPVRMHVPYHGGIPNNNLFPKEIYKLDISEVSGYDIDGEDNPLFKSEKITADFFGVSHSFYLTGGASIGLLAGLIALNKIGKKVIVARNVHKSVINGLILSGLEPVWLDVDFDEKWGVFSKVSPENLINIIKNYKDLAGCVIVSPTYEGIVSDVSYLSEVCHAYEIPLVVDEAHGAHMYFLKTEAKSAVNSGADIVIQSWHKSLGSFTQSGVLHLTSDKYFSYKDLKRSLDLVCSTSPSFLLLLSLELTRKYIAENRNHFNDLLILAQSFRKELMSIKNISLLQNQDPFKIYLKPDDYSGIDLGIKLFEKYSVEIESANKLGVLMQIGQSFSSASAQKILFAINDMSQAVNPAPAAKKAAIKPVNISMQQNPREAFLDGFKNKHNLQYECDVVAPCPPGYATDVPGNNKC
jgi:arginine/lysine/ornithine decarboxylase